MRRQVSDKEVQERIDLMRKQAGSDDIHAMIRAYLQHHVDGFDHYKKVNEMLGRMSFTIFSVFVAFLSAFCLSFWIALSFEPVVSGAISGIGMAFIAYLIYIAKA